MLATIKPLASIAISRVRYIEMMKKAYGLLALLATFLLLAACAQAAEGGTAWIGHGAKNGSNWWASVRGVAHGHSSSSACLDVFVQAKGTGGEATECGTVRLDLPLYERLAEGKGKQRLTVFAAVMPQVVQSVGLNLGSRGFQRMRVDQLGASSAKKAGVDRFSYFARAFRGSICIKRLRGFGESGEVLTDISFPRCHES
jgi:hypothetical protein